jgi:hypothetical protein
MHRTRLCLVASWAAIVGGGACSSQSDATDAGGGSPPHEAGAAPTDDAAATGADAEAVRDGAAAPDGAPAPQDAGATTYDQTAPTPPADWQNATSNLAGKPSECGNMGGVYPDPYSDRLIAGIALDGLWASTDGASTWTAIGTTGDPIKNRLSSIVWDPAHVGTFWESGIYGWETQTDGIFMTSSNGASFNGYSGLATLNETNDSIAIDFGDPQRKTLLAGSHEQEQTLFLSTDSGTTWSNIGASLPSGLGFCTTTLVVDTTTFLVGCAASWSGKAGAILRSTTGGMSWTSVNSAGVVGQPLSASDGAIYWAAEGGGIFKSTDQGQSWTMPASSGAAGTVRPFELPDGRIVSAQQQSIVVSADHGSTWSTVGEPMPYVPNGLSYSPFRNAFYIWYFTCSFAADAAANDIPEDAIEQSGWDYRKN